MQILDITPRLQWLFLANMSVQGHRHTVETLPTTKLSHFCFSNCAIRHRLLKKMFAGQEVKALLYIPNFQAIKTINTGAAFTEAQITELLGSSRQTLRKLTLYPTDPSDVPRIRQYSCLTFLDMPHFGLLPNFESGISSDEIEEGLRLVLPRSLRHLSVGYVLPGHKIEVMMEQLVHLKIQGCVPHIERVSLVYAAEMSMYGLPFDAIVLELHMRVEEVMEEAGIVLEVQLEDE